MSLLGANLSFAESKMRSAKYKGILCTAYREETIPGLLCGS